MTQQPKIENLPTADLIPYAMNSRTHSADQVGQIAASIREFGFTNPVLIDADNGIIAGHGRLLAAQKLKLEEVPCIRLGHLTEAQKRAYVIADNKLALNAGWDEDALKAELERLNEDGFDIGIIGFTSEELEAFSIIEENETEGLTNDDDVDEKPDDPVSKEGDVWILGNHKLMCGDSTSKQDMQKLFDGDKADACWTDPPYNVDYEGSAGKIQNDNMEDAQFRSFLTKAFEAAASVMNDDAAVYVAHADTEGYNFRGAFSDAGFKLSGCLVWVKPSLVLGRSDYQWRHEPILYGWKKGASHFWKGGRKNTTVIEAEDFPISVESDEKISFRLGEKIYEIQGMGMTITGHESSIIRMEKPKKSEMHPTMKPVALIIDMLLNSTKAGDIVLDSFGGSGSTLIACEKTGRRSRLMELDPKFADVIVNRWQEFTGQEATNEKTKKTFAETKARMDGKET